MSTHKLKSIERAAIYFLCKFCNGSIRRNTTGNNPNIFAAKVAVFRISCISSLMSGFGIYERWKFEYSGYFGAF